MLIESAKNLVPKFFDETGATYDGVVSYGTLGKDKYWKRKILEQISNGNSFLDLACGTGILTREKNSNLIQNLIALPHLIYQNTVILKYL